MIKQNVEYEYKLISDLKGIRCYKKKSGGGWYEIKPETYYKETGIKLNFVPSDYEGPLIELSEK